jgi:hypothetical protein
MIARQQWRVRVMGKRYGTTDRWSLTSANRLAGRHCWILALAGLFVSQTAAAAGLPPVSFTSQAVYPSLNPFGNWEALANPLTGLPSLCVETDVWTLSGGALLAPDIRMDDDEAITGYLQRTEDEVERRLCQYLRNHLELGPVSVTPQECLSYTDDLVVVDIEDAIGPANLGKFNHVPGMSQKLLN